MSRDESKDVGAHQIANLRTAERTYEVQAMVGCFSSKVTLGVVAIGRLLQFTRLVGDKTPRICRAFCYVTAWIPKKSHRGQSWRTQLDVR